VNKLPGLEQAFPLPGEIPTAHRLSAPLHQRCVLIDGELRPWDGPNQAVHSPIWTRNGDGTLQPMEVGSHPKGSAEATEAALAAAVNAYANGSGDWPTMTVADRIGCMEEFVRQMLMRKEETVSLIMWEVGKSLADSEKEFDRTVAYIAATIDALKELDNNSSRFVIADGTIGQVRRTPLGVVLCMGPYNYPLNETFATLIPALIMGNTVLLKPPRFGVLLFYPLLDAFRSAFPRGVINTVYGNGADVVPAVLGSGKVNVLTLIGSSKVADHLKKLHPKVNRLRAILGLDAKNAAIVMPDADLELAVKECLLGALSFNGQRCTALKALLVHSAIVPRFVNRLSEEIGKLKIGMPWTPGVSITPLAEPAKAAYLAECIRDAEAHGARVVNPGGGRACKSLFYPALVYPVREGMKLFREEQFGPVIPVIPFEDVGVALDYVAGAENGQQVSIFSTDPALVGRLVDTLVNQVCRVNINCQCQRGPDVFPFTGRKDSAEGTLSVTDALRSFSIRSMIAAKQIASSKQILNAIVNEHRSNFINTRFIL
jgi:glyceraldehyde-3-phosphate dehydrogenase (NADP+)